MKQHRRMPRSMAKRKASPGAFTRLSQPQLPRRAATSPRGWSNFGFPSVMVAVNGGAVIGTINIPAPRKA
jgi:hypothetical protein